MNSVNLFLFEELKQEIRRLEEIAGECPKAVQDEVQELLDRMPPEMRGEATVQLIEFFRACQRLARLFNMVKEE